MSKSAIKFMVLSGIMPSNRYGRQNTFATNRTQLRLRPLLMVTDSKLRKSNPRNQQS